MSFSFMDFVGFSAATLTTVAFLPQVARVWKTKSARDISASMYALFIVGLLIWIAYGLAIGAWPIVYANVLTAMQAITILVLKGLYAQRGGE